MKLSELNKLIYNLQTDIELVENTLKELSDGESEFICTFDHETVAIMKEYMQVRLRYRSLALISLEKVGVVH